MIFSLGEYDAPGRLLIVLQKIQRTEKAKIAMLINITRVFQSTNAVFLRHVLLLEAGSAL